MEPINISQAFDNTGHNGSSKDYTGLTQSDQSRIDYVIVSCLVVNVLLCFTALLGNCSILVTLWRTPSLHSMTNNLLASLALSDFAVDLVVQPLYISNLLKKDLHSSFGIVFTILTLFCAWCLSSPQLQLESTTCSRFSYTLLG